jgi:hypothetical protein
MPRRQLFPCVQVLSVPPQISSRNTSFPDSSLGFLRTESDYFLCVAEIRQGAGQNRLGKRDSKALAALGKHSIGSLGHGLVDEFRVDPVETDTVEDDFAVVVTQAPSGALPVNNAEDMIGRHDDLVHLRQTQLVILDQVRGSAG